MTETPPTRSSVVIQVVVVCAALLAAFLVYRQGSTSVPVPSQTASKHVADCRPGHIEVMSDVMNCRMAPFSKSQLSEEEFRETLAKLRELSPDPSWDNGDNGWPEIIDSMLQDKQYMAGCKRCHRAFMDSYRRQYRDRKFGPL